VYPGRDFAWSGASSATARVPESPLLQRHFELLGWNESTMVMRFWLVAALFVALGLGIFHLEFLPADIP
jgi:phospho-N-acetylmuramoyl-pentapeptide-transferase